MTIWREGIAHVEAILGALTISPDGVTLGTRTLAAQRAQPAQREAVLARLLYEECFIKGLGEREPPRDRDTDPAAFVAELSASNAGASRISEGWRFDGWNEGGQMLVVRDGRRHTVSASLVRRSGDAVTIHASKDDLASSADFYYAYGDALPLGEPRVERTRFYVNVASEGAAPMVGALTRGLNAEHVPFSLKCFRDPHEYYRRDGMVAYVDVRWAPSTAEIVSSAAADLGDVVRDATPIFTQRVRSGVACAPQPDSGSYGARCCRVLAAAILSANERSASSVVDAAENLERV